MWEAFFEALKDRGRNCALFVLLTVAVVPAMVFWSKGGGVAWVILITVVISRILSSYRSWRPPAGRLGKLPPLSRNDLEAARSKLLRQRNKMKP